MRNIILKLSTEIIVHFSCSFEKKMYYHFTDNYSYEYNEKKNKMFQVKNHRFTIIVLQEYDPLTLDYLLLLDDQDQKINEHC